MRHASRKQSREQHIHTMEHDPKPPALARERLLWLSFAIAAPPTFWILQLLFLSAFAIYSCFPAFMPLTVPKPDMAWVWTLELACDVFVIVMTIASGWVALHYYQLARNRIAAHGDDALSLWQLDRLCFMSLGGMLSSAGFLLAILFEAIASIMVAPCAG